MNSGRYVLSQLLDLIHWQTLSRLVERYNAESNVRHFGCRQQLICMVFAQLTWREGLCIATCLNAKPSALHHLGFGKSVAKSTLADANEQRDWRLWEDLAKGLMRKARAGIKMHTQIDLREPIPTCIHITGARQHDVGWLDSLLFEPGAFYLMDRGYMDFARLFLIAKAGVFFVTRAKSKLQFTRHYSLPVDRFTGLRSDHVGKPSLAKSRNAFPALLRKVRYYDSETERELIFLTNNLEIPALKVAMLYKARWRIELFFRWIKQHLRIKHFYGTSPNAVTTYLMVAIIHKQMKLPGTLHRTLQLLSVHPFEKMTLNELLTETDHRTFDDDDPNQLNLF